MTYHGKFLSAGKHTDPQPPQERPGVSGKYWTLPLLLFLSGALPEVLLHLATSEGSVTLWNSGILLGVLFALVPALFLFALVSFLPFPRFNRFLVLSYSLIFYILCASQLVYYRVFGTFYSAFSMTNGGQVLQFWNIILSKIWENLLLLIAMALPLLCLLVGGKRWFRYDRIAKPVLSMFPLFGAVLLQVALVLSLPLFGTEPMSPYDLYHQNADSYFSINRLGLATAFRLDVYRLATGFQPDGSIELEFPTDDPLVIPTNQTPIETTKATEPATTAPQSTAVPEGTTAPTVTTVPPTTEAVTTAPTIDTSPNMLDIDFEALINSTKDKKLKEVHQYFASRTPSNKNEHTGIFAGKNLIMITAEAFSHLAVDEKRTPTLYKMIHEGYYFTDYYVSDWGTSTTDGEYAFLTGTVPKSGVWSFYRSAKNEMPLTMSQQLISQGYNAYAYHGHTYSYYHRDQYLENLGFTYRAYKKGLPVTYVWPESDVEVVDLSTADYVNSEPFVTYYMTISGHREFSFTGNSMSYKNKSLVADEPYSSNVRAYLACQLELEFSLQLLFQRLEEAGVLDNTVIVLTADHYPNGLTTEELSELAGHKIDTSFEIYKNACIIYTPGMTPETIDEPCSHLDLLPTLSNLFGLEFDSRLYMGRDVFSNAEPFVMFLNRNWMSNVAAYKYNKDTVIQRTQYEVLDFYVKKMNRELSNRFTVSSRILDYDYWDILFD